MFTKNSFQIWMNDGTNVQVKFTEQQESDVTTALKEHASMQLLVKGQGEFSPDGALQQIQDVKYLKIIPNDEDALDTRAPRIEDVISEIFSKVSDQEWDRVPSRSIASS